MVCRFCERESVEYWFGNWCQSCRKLKNLGNVYGFERILEILQRCCIRNPEQIKNKIDLVKEINEVYEPLEKLKKDTEQIHKIRPITRQRAERERREQK